LAHMFHTPSFPIGGRGEGGILPHPTP
jgi:hypothetical protein